VLRRAATRPISQGMSKRATVRPEGFRKPAHWSDAPPPAPEPASGGAEELGPTRYGDWVRKGIAIDF
jgi:hypothetical protein